MINTENHDKNNDVTVAGTDFFADSENFLNELTDSEMVQVRGGEGVSLTGGGGGSGISILLCL